MIRAGAGTNTIDTEAAARSGVLVSNVPGRNAVAVAELTMGLILALDRRIADNVVDARRVAGTRSTYSKANGLLGSTLGIVGLGSIGLAVAERAAAFGIRVRCAGPAGPRQATSRPGRAELDVAMCDSLAELLAASDVVSLHVPASAETREPRGRRLPGRDEPGAILAEHLARRRGRRGRAARGAGRRARPRRPRRVRRRAGRRHRRVGLRRSPSTPVWSATHHIGASTEQAQRAIAAGVAEIVEAFAAGEARNCVNLEPRRLG